MANTMRVSSLQIVVTFAPDRGILFTSGKQLLELQKLLGSKLMSLNVPDAAPPEAPRAMLASPDAIVALGFNRLDITTKPPDHIAHDYTACVSFAERKVQPIIESISQVVDYKWAGVVSVNEYPLASGDISSLKIVSPIFDRLVNIQRHGKELASFQLQYGYKHNDFFKNFTIKGYETRNISLEIDTNEAGPVKIDLSKYPISESGVEITIDFNNKAASKRSNVMEDVIQLFKEQIASHSVLANELNLEGLMS